MKVIILAGGSGKRLWPLSRQQLPKQCLNFGAETSLLQQTVVRNLELVSLEDLFVVVGENLCLDVQQQLKEIAEPLASQVIVEKASKNSAAAIALALLFLQKEGRLAKNEVLLVVPSDHFIESTQEYVLKMREGAKLAATSGAIVLFGVKADYPETDFGYIHIQRDEVIGFVEKPDLERAMSYVEEGNYLWNLGMFAFTFEAIAEQIKKLSLEPLTELFTAGYEELQKRFFELPSISFDHAILDRSTSLRCIRFETSWSDMGSWERIWQNHSKDGSGNSCQGDVIALNCENSLLFSHKRLVVALGLKEQIVVETEDALLVANKNSLNDLKKVVEDLNLLKRSEAAAPLLCTRPWGSYHVLEEGLRYKIKKIIVKPYERLSLQFHYYRSEHWVVVRGTAKVTINGESSLVGEGQSLFVPKSAIHRVENPGKVPLEIIEVQVGEYLGEDDIVRLEDVYGRLKEKENFEIAQQKLQEKRD